MYKLQNGSDIRGIAYKNDFKEVNLTEESAKKIFYSFYEWLRKKSNKESLKIAIGRDSRITGKYFSNIAIEAFRKCGCEVIYCDLSTTPAMFMTVIADGYNCDGSIMITASHLPYYYNGFKFFSKDGGLEKKDIKDILDMAIKDNYKLEYDKKGHVENKNLIDDYADILLSEIRRGVNSKKNYEQPLKECKIIVDAGNGAGGFFADKILKKLGADTNGSQFLEPDGMFPNHIPNPENKDAMKSISDAVIKSNADLGIIFDTDVDRAALVGKNGTFINKNALIALISKIVLSEHPGTTIVTDSITSDGLTKFIKDLGGKHHRFKRGYRNVINEAIRLNSLNEETHLAIETSGHAALKENYFLDDGAYLIAKILIEFAKISRKNLSIVDLISKLEQPLEEKEYRIGINLEDFKPYAEGIIEDLKKFVLNTEDFKLVPNNYEGIRVNCNIEKGWFLLRISLHEPLLVLTIESDITCGIDKIHAKLTTFLRKYKMLNI